MQQSVHQIQDNSQYKHLKIMASTAKKKQKKKKTTSAFVVFENVLEASLTICVDKTVPDVGESDLGPHDLPICLYAADNFSRCGIVCLLHTRIQEFSPRGGVCEGVPGRKKLNCLKKQL